MARLLLLFVGVGLSAVPVLGFYLTQEPDDHIEWPDLLTRVDRLTRRPQ